ncbi:MAG: hypothetical protein RL070_1464 [Bacteroidota bacterium]
MKLDLLQDNKLIRRHSEIEKIRSQGLMDNDLKVKYSRSIIEAYGQLFQVSPPPKKSMKMKSGSCYGNAHSKREKGYEYVEGIIKSKITGTEISHAWNVDSTGKHIDFTIMETEEYEYRGIVIPFSLRYKVSEKTGRIWYCVLPYISFEQ